MKFIESNSIKIELNEKDWDMVSKPEVIEKVINDENVIAFDILNENNKIIGFSMLRKFDEHSFFLWEFAIDKNFQNKGLGKISLIELINMLKENYGLNLLTTTYTYGNEVARKLYEDVGFVQIGVVNEDGIHEVDMKLELD